MSIPAKIPYGVGLSAALAALSLVSAAAPAAASAGPGYLRLAGSVAGFAAQAQATGSMPGSRQLTIQVWLRPNLASAQAFATEVSTPGSPRFRQFLSPDAYAARFGATSAKAARVEAWLRRSGFTAVHADAQRSYVRGTAATSTIEAAFRTQLRLYPASAQANAGPYQLYANATPVSVPASLAGSVLGVTGLDNAAPIVPLAWQNPGRLGAAAMQAGPRVSCSHYYGQHSATGVPAQHGSTSFPSQNCGYDAGQIRAAYRASFRDTGKGRTIALVELGLARDMFLTLRDYARVNGMPAPSPSRYHELSLGKGTACGDTFDVEEQLDVEASYVMAPGASQLVIGGDTCNNGDFGLQGLFNADVAVLNGSHGRPLASVVSNSWESGDESQPPLLTSIENAYLVRAAAEGVGMYFSSGDGSGVQYPSASPFAIAVGGTTLGLGKRNVRLFETGWSSGVSRASRHGWVLWGEDAAAGGGPSAKYRQPQYQQRIVPARLAAGRGGLGGVARSAPDISAVADPYTGFAEGMLTFRAGQAPVYGEFPVGGTSLAAPLVAGMVAAAEQGQPRPFGFINPALYRLAGTGAFFDPAPLTGAGRARYGAIFCDARACGREILITSDDQSWRMAGYTGQVTLGGYDNMTGIGTPNGPSFITALRRLER